MSPTVTAATVLDDIHRLANDRAALYRRAGQASVRTAMGAKSLSPDEREQLQGGIKDLTRQLDEHWALHRALLAAPHYRPRRVIVEILDDRFDDYLERASINGIQPAALLDDLDGFTIDLLPIVRAVRRDHLDNPVPLRDLLARRGLTLRWMNAHGGAAVVRPVEKVG